MFQKINVHASVCMCSFLFGMMCGVVWDFCHCMWPKEAYGYLASKCFTRGMKLFRLRPKIHFQQHITMLLNLGDVGFSALSFLGSMRHLCLFIHIVLGCLGTPILLPRVIFDTTQISHAGVMKTTLVE